MSFHNSAKRLKYLYFPLCTSKIKLFNTTEFLNFIIAQLFSIAIQNFSSLLEVARLGSLSLLFAKLSLQFNSSLWYFLCKECRRFFKKRFSFLASSSSFFRRRFSFISFSSFVNLGLTFHSSSSSRAKPSLSLYAASKSIENIAIFQNLCYTSFVLYCISYGE